MWALLTLTVFLAIGLGVWQGILLLGRVYEDKTPQPTREFIYRTTKTFPQLVLNIAFTAIFFLSLGGTLFQWVIHPFLGDKLGLDMSWAPGVLFSIVSILVVSYWRSPQKPFQSPKIRGRALKTARDGNTPIRGRTIRSYKDLE